MSKKDVMNYFEVTPEGLTNEEVIKRQETYGSNTLREAKKETIWEIFLDQFKDILIIILIFAAIISASISYRNNEGFTDAFLIGFILIVNAFMGVYQEWKADKAIEALKQMIAHHCRVVRGGEVIDIESKDLVPGDIIAFEQGDRIPADGRIIEANSLRTEEAQLTGESTEVQKSSFAKVPESAALGDFINSVFMGTHVTFGKGRAVVTRIGMATEMGKIADSVQEISKDPTPTQEKLEDFGKKLSTFILSLMAIMVLYGRFVIGFSFTDILLIAVSLAVAAIPEGLPIVITLAMALGVQRMAKKEAIVKKLAAVESLGSVTVICSDKTGTLTLNQMTVQKIVQFDRIDITSNPQDRTLQPTPITSRVVDGAILCNNSRYTSNIQFGDPTELALLRFADDMNLHDRHEIENRYERLDEIPFDSERKRMTVVVEDKETGKRSGYTKGAPEILLQVAKYVDLGNGIEPLTLELSTKIQAIVDELAGNALRVLAFGYADLESPSYNIYEFEEKIVLCGLIGMIDPPKEGVIHAVQVCKDAGIRVIMVTGDHLKTAVAIGKEIGIVDDATQVIDGQDLDKISDQDLAEHIESYHVFARISPHHKLKIVRALKANGHIVAMTGDGVNDAPALKGSDVGIAMGSGTDVTKETADMVLENDNFTTIVHAIEEGRGIFDNMTKFIKYMLASNTAEIVVIFLGIVLGLPTPLIAVQILWVNLVTDGVPALALGVDPAAEGIMVRKPRDPKESLLAAERINHIILIGFYMSLVTLGSYILSYETNLFGTKGEIEKARTIAFCILSFSQFAHSINVREDTNSILGKPFFKNRLLIITVILSIILQVFVIQGDIIVANLTNTETTFFADLFETAPLTIWQWIYVALVSSSLIFYVEVLKLIKRHTKFTHIC